MKVFPILHGWTANLLQEASAPGGWQLFAKSVAFLTGLVGLLLTFLALTLSFETEKVRRNEESLRNFLTELSSPQERLRVGAINRIPDLLARRGPPRDSVGTISLIKRSLGFGEPQIHAQEVREQVRQLLVSGPFDGQPLSSRESTALVDALRRTPPAVWFEDDRMARDATFGLRWIWDDTPRSTNVAIKAFTRALFTEAALTGVTFTDLDLSGATLTGLTCTDCRFVRTRLVGANLTGAHFTKSFFDYAVLDEALLTSSLIEDSSFYATSLRGVRLSKSTILNSQFHQPNFGESRDGADLRGVTVRSTTFTECVGASGASFVLSELLETRFYRCHLNGASFRGAVLAAAVFDGSSLVGVDLSDTSAPRASFVNAVLDGAIITRANLLSADLTGATGLAAATAANSITNMTNANLARVQGIDSDTLLLLIQLGAVELDCDEAWQSYKRAGYPYENWLSYRTCPPE